MNRVLILVEGPTERAVVEQVLAPHFGQRSVSLHAKVLGKPGHKGGIRNFEAVRKEVLALMNQERRSFVSTFFDYYGLPTSWPGLSEAHGKPAQEKARIVETAMLENVRSILSKPDHPNRFLPYVQMHELEALLFSNPKIMASTFESPSLSSSFAEIVRQCGECEEIDDKSETSPSRRIARLFPAYRKGGSLIAHAPIIAKRIGLDAIRQACPHFNAWRGGFDRYDFVMDDDTLAIKPFKVEKDEDIGPEGRPHCIVVVPRKAASGNPWCWRDFHPGHQSQTEVELLERGFHVACITPGGPGQRDAWHRFLTEKHGLSKKPVFAGMSGGGELQAGTAKVSITPENPKLPIHDKVYARSLVLEVNGERVGFVSVDLGIYTNEHLVAVCKEKFGLSQFVLSSSHTHSDPGRAYASFYEEQIIQAVDAAVKNLFPARLSAGHRSFPQLGFNRLIVREDGHARESWFSDDHYTSENPERIPFGPVDPEVGVIKIEDLKGQARAMVMNYACHADVVCQNYAISADYPGVAARKVEEAFGNNLNCLFVQGAGGNIESLIISSRRTGPEDPFQTDYNSIERVGGLLAYETVKLAKTLSPKPGNETSIKYMNDALKFTGRFDKRSNFDIHISTITINDDIVIATCPGEPFIQLQLDWKKKVEAAHPFVFGYTWFQGTWPNYVPDIRSAALGGYGADQASPNMIEVGSGEAIMNKHLENVYRLTGFMREEPGPVGFTAGPRWLVTPVPRTK